MSELGFELASELGADGTPLSLVAAESGALTGWRIVLYEGSNPDDESRWVWHREVKATDSGTPLTSAVVPLALVQSRTVKAAVQAIYWGTTPGPWRSSDGTVTIDPETTPIPATDTVARGDAATALTLAGSKTAVFYSADAPPNPNGGYNLRAGDLWFNTTSGTSDTHYCRDYNCRGHILDANGNPRVGSLIQHRSKYWTHRWDGSAWKDAQRDALIVASEIAAGAIVTDKLAANAITVDKLSVGAISDNLFPNGNSEQSPPAGADLTTAEWAWRVQSGAYAGNWRRYKGNTAGVSQAWLVHPIPCSPGDAFVISAQCAVAGSVPAGVYVLFCDAADSILTTLIYSGTYYTTTNAWTPVTYSATAPAGAVVAKLGLFVNAGGDGTWDSIVARRKVAGAVLDVASIAADEATVGGTQLQRLTRRYTMTVSSGVSSFGVNNVFSGAAGDPVPSSVNTWSAWVVPLSYTGTPTDAHFIVKQVVRSLDTNGTVIVYLANPPGSGNTSTWEIGIARAPTST